ncbi:MAG: hypothetical protein JKY34_13185 [Kordiimonadaceae bacterium]|nr:hypothetical protein [Kordiimonadaceae bacterium]
MAVPGRIIIEFVNVGSALKVCAICERTGREVSIVGDPKASREHLKRVAANKLRFVMAKEDDAPPGKGGIFA